MLPVCRPLFSLNFGLYISHLMSILSHNSKITPRTDSLYFDVNSVSSSDQSPYCWRDPRQVVSRFAFLMRYVFLDAVVYAFLKRLPHFICCHGVLIDLNFVHGKLEFSLKTVPSCLFV